MRRLGLVVVTYQSADVLPGCLDALAAGSDGIDLEQIVVVDNASSDDSLRIAKGFAGYPVRTVQLGRNAGYAAGVNAGITALDLDQLDAVMVLNPDCRLRPGALAALAAALTRPHVGIAAPRLVNPDGTLQLSLRRPPTVRRALAESLLGKYAARIGTLGELVGDPAAYDRPGNWSWATGAALLVSVAVVAEVGDWDESLLLYSEETDFILRAADRGWRLRYEPDAVIEHIGGESAGRPMLAALIATNRVFLFRRRHGRPSGIAFYLAVVMGEGLRAMCGRQPSRAAFIALVRPSRRLRELP